MRFSNVILGLFSVGMIGAGSLVGCGDSGGGGAGGGGTGGGASSSSSSSGSTSGGFPCSPAASCKAADKECIGLIDNAGLTKFGLRMSELAVTAPGALTTGIVAGIVGGAVAPSNAACNLNGTETFNWLLQFDTAAGTLKTGGAKPVADATKGYDFVNETVQGKQIAPITFDGVTPDASGNFSVTTGKDLLVPIYLDAAGTSVVLLPLKDARLAMGTVSKSQNCIGHYNAEGLDPANSCLADATNKAFITGASLDGIITLEAADTVTIDTLQQSLCVMLSQDSAMYGEKDANGITVCKRTAGVIDFKGDACSDGGTCTDAVKLAAQFAASSVQINN